MAPKHQLILASQSPRRKQLLEWAEISFEVVTKNTDESFPENLPTEDVPVHIARQKALAVQEHLQNINEQSNKPILAADTVVVLGEEIIGKPKDKKDALAILSALSGKKHKVITGVVLLKGNEEFYFSDTTEVTFYPFTQQQIEYYIDKYKPMDKAGAYAIQEWIGVTGIKFIKGDFYNVMGLPVSRVVRLLNELTPVKI
ncbi:Maf family protein [Chitinophagaceae bacterium LWZ2-11]